MDESSENLYLNLEKLSFETIDNAYIYIRWVNYAIVGLLGAIALVLFAFLSEWEWLYGVGSVLLWLCLCGLLGWYRKFEVVRRRYAINEAFLVYESGLFLHTIEVVPLSRIQHTSLEQGWLSKRRGLGSLVIYTAGNQEQTLSIKGMKYTDAKRYNSFLLKHLDLNEEPIDIVKTDE